MAGRAPIRLHAHPVSPDARRQAERAGWRPADPGVEPAIGGVGPAIGGVQPAVNRAARAIIGLRGSPARGRPVALALLVLGAAIAASSQLGSIGFGLAGSRPSVGPSGDPLPSLGIGIGSSTAAGPSDAPSATADLPTGYQWPVEHARITSWFGPLSGEPYLVDGEPFHDGIDIASFCGDHVAAAHDGTVLVAGRDVDPWYGWVGDYGAHEAVIYAKKLLPTLAIVVITDDGNGYRSIYMHLAKAVVTAGQQVRAGQLIGEEGRTGNATGCHLHFSIYSPTETAVFETAPWAIKRWTLPAAEIARIDPLLVLPPMASADVTWGWGARD